VVEEIKAIWTDISRLNEVKIFNAKGELVRIVQAKRLEHDFDHFQQKKRSNKIKYEKNLKASDLIEI